MRMRTTSAGCASQDETFHSLRVIEHKLRSDPPAHRDAENMRLINSERSQENCCVVCQLAQGHIASQPVARPGTAMGVSDDLEARAKQLYERPMPARCLGRETRDQE